MTLFYYNLYDCLSNAVKKVLITPSINQKKMTEKDIRQYEEVIFIDDDHSTPNYEWIAYRLNKKYKFDSVKIIEHNNCIYF